MLPDNHTAALQTVLLRVTQEQWTRRWNYYMGNHPKIWATPKMNETFRDLADSFVENYCGLAVNARISRLEVTGWDGDKRAEEIWEAAALPHRQDIMYRWGLAHGVCYMIAQDDMIAVNPATIAYAQADPNDWAQQAWAGKAWLDIDSGHWHATLWDETTIYRYENVNAKVGYTPNETLQMYSPAGQDFQLVGEDYHGYSQVPVVPMNPFGFQAAPLLDQIAPIQDKINKLSANKFVAAEFGAFKQRVFFTRQQLDPYEVRQQPDHAIVLDPGDVDGRASVQELGGTDLSVYDSAKESEIDALFTIGMLPRHLRANVRASLSGEAMKADEAPFVESLHDHQREFGEAMTDIMRIMGVEATPIWRDVSPRDEYHNAQTVDLLVQAGMPWQVAVSKYMGITPDEIAEAEAIYAAEKRETQTALAAQTQGLLMNPFIAQQQTAIAETPGEKAKEIEKS